MKRLVTTPPKPAAPEVPFAWARSKGLGLEIAELARAEARRRSRRRWLAAAATSSAVLVAVLFWPRGESPSVAPVAETRGRASVMMPERQVLTDGSVVELRGGAALEVMFTPTGRRVALLRGEAHFAVTKDEARPFVVAAHGVEVRAVGTAFAVAQGEAGVEVLVTQGRVAVARTSPDKLAAAPSSAPTPRPGLAELSAGSRTMVAVVATAEPPAVVAVTAEEISRRLAWRVPRLEFDSAPLSEVARLFREHGHVKIVLAEAALNDVRVSGVLRADNTDALLQLLAADHGIEAVRQGPVLVLRRPTR